MMKSIYNFLKRPVGPYIPGLCISVTWTRREPSFLPRWASWRLTRLRFSKSESKGSYFQIADYGAFAGLALVMFVGFSS